MGEQTVTKHARAHGSLLAPAEKRALIWMAERLPGTYLATTHGRLPHRASESRSDRAQNPAGRRHGLSALQAVGRGGGPAPPVQRGVRQRVGRGQRRVHRTLRESARDALRRGKSAGDYDLLGTQFPGGRPFRVRRPPSRERLPQSDVARAGGRSEEASHARRGGMGSPPSVVAHPGSAQNTHWATRPVRPQPTTGCSVMRCRSSDRSVPRTAVRPAM